MSTAPRLRMIAGPNASGKTTLTKFLLTLNFKFGDYIRERDYRTYLYYICTDDVLINRNRIVNRVKLGGHNVPEDKIEPRYERSLDLLLEAIKHSDRAYLFDNSGPEHILIAEVTNGKQIELKTHDIPGWFIRAVYKKIIR